MTTKSSLTLNEQLCFPVYGSTRIISRLYQPVLSKFHLNYPGYMVMLLLWDSQEIKFSQIRRQLYLNEESLLPILQELQNKNYIELQQGNSQISEVVIKITPTGEQLKSKARRIPFSLSKILNTPVEELGSMHLLIRNFLNRFEKKR